MPFRDTQGFSHSWASSFQALMRYQVTSGSSGEASAPQMATSTALPSLAVPWSTVPTTLVPSSGEEDEATRRPPSSAGLNGWALSLGEPGTREIMQRVGLLPRRPLEGARQCPQGGIPAQGDEGRPVVGVGLGLTQRTHGLAERRG